MAYIKENKTSMKTLVIRIFFLFLLVILFVYSLNSENSKSGIQYIISLNKNQFIEGEDINLTVKFINASEQVDSLININESQIIKNLLINSPENQKQNYVGPVEGKTRNIILKPGEEYLITSNIRFYRGTTTVGLFNYFQESTYHIKGYYQLGKHSIESNELIFDVISPPEAEKKVLSEILRLNKECSKEKYQDSLAVTIDEYDYLIKTNPTSIYLDEVFINVTLKKRISGIKYDSTLIEDCLWFIENRPNSPNLDFVINEAAELIYLKYGGKDKVIAFLEELQNKYPSSKIYKISEEFKHSPKFR